MGNTMGNRMETESEPFAKNSHQDKVNVPAYKMLQIFERSRNEI